jgi:hypothetical protein
MSGICLSELGLPMVLIGTDVQGMAMRGLRSQGTKRINPTSAETGGNESKGLTDSLKEFTMERNFKANRFGVLEVCDGNYFSGG